MTCQCKIRMHSLSWSLLCMVVLLAWKCKELQRASVTAWHSVMASRYQHGFKIGGRRIHDYQCPAQPSCKSAIACFGSGDVIVGMSKLGSDV